VAKKDAAYDQRQLHDEKKRMALLEKKASKKGLTPLTPSKTRTTL